MPGGGLVVLDRLGRDVKRYSLPEGMATLGSDALCDIRVLLPSVSGHHATVVVRPSQTVIRNVSETETLVNDRPVTVMALRHGDIITLGDRSLRWEYDDPAAVRLAASPPSLLVKSVGKQRVRGRKRASDIRPRQVDPAVRLLMELNHRHSMPANDTNPRVTVKPHRPYAQANMRRRNSKADCPKNDNNGSISEKTKRKTSTPKLPPKTHDLQNTTKATLWIESRKSSPRRSTAVAEKPKYLNPSLSPRNVSASANKPVSLRTVTLRKSVIPNATFVATLAKKTPVARVAKIQAPSTIDHTKQAALMLITGHTAKSKTVSPKEGKNTIPNKTLKSDQKSPKSAKTTPLRTQRASSRRSKEMFTSEEVTSSNQMVHEISHSDSRQSRSRGTLNGTLTSPRKSSMKDPKAKKGIRKSESIKFDLTNLDNCQDDSTDVMFVSNNSTRGRSYLSNNTNDSSQFDSISSIKPIHSRSSNILEKSLGMTTEATDCERTSLTPKSPSARRSIRNSLVAQKVSLSSDENNSSRSSNRVTRFVSDENSTIMNMTKTLSPRSSKIESYSIVDLVSINSNESESTVYNSIGSESTAFGTPKTSTRRTRSTIDPTLLGSSTPYVGKTPKKSSRSTVTSRASKSSPIKISSESLDSNKLSLSTRRSKSLTIPASEGITFTSKRSSSLSTPENAKRPISINSTRLSRASRKTLNDSEVLILSVNEGRSPKSTKRSSRFSQRSLMSTPESPSLLNPKSSRNSKMSAAKSRRVSATKSAKDVKSPRVSATKSAKEMKSPRISATKFAPVAESPRISRSKTTAKKSSGTETSLSVSGSPVSDGLHTPDNAHSPQDQGTPVLNIQSLLDSSDLSLHLQNRNKRVRLLKKTPIELHLKRKTIGVKRGTPRRSGIKSKSTDSSNASDRTDKEAPKPPNEKTITPKSSVKLTPVAVKEKHSTAKKPQSKRSLIDNLKESDTVKSLFNSPVKRKLSQSMTEFSRTQLFEDNPERRSYRRSSQTFFVSTTRSDQTFTSEEFASTLTTPGNSPEVSRADRLFRRTRGSKSLHVSPPKTRKSIKNDLTNVSGVKRVFAKSPRNRLSDFRGVKEVFTSADSPANDLRRVSGVKSLFQTKRTRNSPKNDLTDVRGVKRLYQETNPKNEPNNDLHGVSSVKRLFTTEKSKDGLNDLSGVEELFDTSFDSHKNSPRNQSALQNSKNSTENLFDQLIGKPHAKATYARSFVRIPVEKAKSKRSAKSLNVSFDLISNNVEKWLENDVEKSRKDVTVSKASISKGPKTINTLSKTSPKRMAREILNLATDTVEGSAPVRTSRIRISPVTKRKSIIYKKKSTSQRYSENALLTKKKFFVHSTPVKGVINETALALGRVSPIISQPEAFVRVSRLTLASSTPKPTTSRKTKFDLTPTPKTTIPTKMRRGRSKELLDTRGLKRKANTEVEIENEHPKAKRGKMAQEAIVEPNMKGRNPKNKPLPRTLKENARAKKTVVVSPAAPVRSTRQKKTAQEAIVEPYIKGRNLKNKPGPGIVKENARAKKTVVVSPVVPVRSTRQKKTAQKAIAEPNMEGRNPKNKPGPGTVKENARAKKTVVVSPVVPVRSTRQKKAAQEAIVEPNMEGRNPKNKPLPRTLEENARAKKTVVVSPAAPVRSTRQKKTIQEAIVEPNMKGRNPKNKPLPRTLEENARAKKTVVVSPVVPVRSTRQKKTIQEAIVEPNMIERNPKNKPLPRTLEENARAKKTVVVSPAAPVRSTRQKKTAQEAIVEPYIKGRNLKNKPGPGTVKETARAKKTVVVRPAAPIRSTRQKKQ